MAMPALRPGLSLTALKSGSTREVSHIYLNIDPGR
jgi:hypothetical protein